MSGLKSPRSLEQAADQSHLPQRAVLVLASIDPRALGVACGLVFGLWLFSATLVLVLRGGPEPGRNLILLSQYFTGFRVSFAGAFLASIYGFLLGFLVGYLGARTRNFMIRKYLWYLRRRAERMEMADLLDRIL